MDEWQEWTVTVPPGENARLDRFLAESTGLTRSRVQRLLRDGMVEGPTEILKVSTQVQEGEVYLLRNPPPESLDAIAQDIPLDILYEDEHMLAVNKPCGMVTHPAPGNPKDTLVNALLFHCALSGRNGAVRPGIVHRLDKDTTGILLVAKNDAAHQGLAEQIESRSMGKWYWAIVQGKVETGRVEAPIGRHPTDRKRMAVVRDGRYALTEYHDLEHLRGATWAEIRLHTGRTHQIRVHMAAIGHPVLGDGVYGHIEKAKPQTQMLHARRLEFKHPITGVPMVLEAPAPDEFHKWLTRLREN